MTCKISKVLLVFIFLEESTRGTQV